MPTQVFELRREIKVKNRYRIIKGKYPNMEACIADAMRKTKDLSYIVFSKIDFYKIAFEYMKEPDLVNYNFSHSNFKYCYFNDLFLTNCKFDSCSIDYCMFTCSVIQNCSITHASLIGSTFFCTSISHIDLSYSNYVITDMLGINLRGISSPELIRALMRYDCSILPNGPALFHQWAKERGNPSYCPFSNKCSRQLFVFYPRHDLWKKGPLMPLYELWALICKELSITITEEVIINDTTPN